MLSKLLGLVWPVNKVRIEYVYDKFSHNVRTKTTYDTETNSETYEEYDAYGQLVLARWKKQGKHYRDNDLPHKEEYKKGTLYSQTWCMPSNGSLMVRNDNKPSRIIYYPNGEIQEEIFMREDLTLPDQIKYSLRPQYHAYYKHWNTDGGNYNIPKYEYYNQQGKVIKRVYSYLNTLGLPNIQIWDSAGTHLLKEMWCSDDYIPLKYAEPEPSEILAMNAIFLYE